MDRIFLQYGALATEEADVSVLPELYQWDARRHSLLSFKPVNDAARPYRFGLVRTPAQR